MKLTHEAAGTFAIAPTPFHADGRIDTHSIDRMTDFYLNVGCSGITVLGIMGEAPKLDSQEGQIVTGLLYMEREPEDLHIHLNTVSSPLNTLEEQELCPGGASLDEVNAGLR